MNDQNNILQELNFVPEWARQPAGNAVQINVSRDARQRSERRGEPRKDGAPARRPRRSGAGQGRPADPTRADTPRRRMPRRNDPAAADGIRHTLPTGYRISFIPERRGLKPLVAQLARTRRAWPLNDVAKMFLSKPDFYAVKIETTPPPKETEATDDTHVPDLFQCAECLQIFQTRNDIVNHALRAHFAQFFDMEEQPGEAPKGNFSIVARCGLSGILLGPPNYHLYNEKIQEVHRQRFPDMPMEDYRRHIVNETDPDKLEQWKQEVSRQTIYKTKRETEPQTFNRLAEAEDFFQTTYLPQLIREGRRFITPGTAVPDMEDQALMRAIRQNWLRENRSPLRITLAVRPAFKQMGLHIFRTPDKTAYITSINPRPLGDSQTTDEIAFILQFVTSHPYCTAAELFEAWLKEEGKPAEPSSTEEQEDTAPPAIAVPLHWLTDKGHIIEFFDGKLLVPGTGDAAPVTPPSEEAADATTGADNNTQPPDSASIP